MWCQRRLKRRHFSKRMTNDSWWFGTTFSELAIATPQWGRRYYGKQTLRRGRSEERKKNVNGPVNNCIMLLYGQFGTYHFGLFGFISIIRGSNEHRFCFLDWAWVRMPTNGRTTRSEYQTEPFEEKSRSELTSRTKYSVNSLYITPDITLLWTQREESSCKILMASYIIPVERKNKKLPVF